MILSLGCSELQVQIQHERSPVHIQSSLDLSYGNQWNQGSNKQRVLLNQSLRNQSGDSLTSYALEVKPFHIWHILLLCTAPRSLVQSWPQDVCVEFLYLFYECPLLVFPPGFVFSFHLTKTLPVGEIGYVKLPLVLNECISLFQCTWLWIHSNLD